MMFNFNIPTTPSLFALGDAASPNGPSALGQRISDIAVESPAVAAAAVIHGMLRIVGAGVAGVHGYRRHSGSVGAAIGWSVLGFIAPIITNAVGFAQGYSTPIK